jgi:hypothetical protein
MNPGKGGERPVNNSLKRVRLTCYAFSNTSMLLWDFLEGSNPIIPKSRYGTQYKN